MRIESNYDDSVKINDRILREEEQRSGSIIQSKHPVASNQKAALVDSCPIGKQYY